MAFKQPEGKPSILSYFICSIKLFQILGFALRTIVRLFCWHVFFLLILLVQYSINKSKIFWGLGGPDKQQNIVAELDSALNKWSDSVPEHSESQ